MFKTLEKSSKGLLLKDSGLFQFGLLEETLITNEFKTRSRDTQKSTVKMRFISTGVQKQILAGQEIEIDKKYFTNLSFHCKSENEANVYKTRIDKLKNNEVYTLIKNEKSESDFSVDEDSIIVMDEQIKKEGGFYITEYGTYLTGKLDTVDIDSKWNHKKEDNDLFVTLNFFKKVNVTKKVGSVEHTSENTIKEKFYLKCETEQDQLKTFLKFKNYQDKEILLKIKSENDSIVYQFDIEDLKQVLDKQQKAS